MTKPELTPLMQRLIRTRAERGWSQNELARRSGVAPAQLSRYESGKNTPRTEVLWKLATALSVDMLWLIDGQHHDPDMVSSVELARPDSLHSVEAETTAKDYIVQPRKFVIPKDMEPVLKELADKEGKAPSELAAKLLKLGMDVFANIPEEILRK